VSYNASAVTIYSAASSLVGFKNKNTFILSTVDNALSYYNAGAVHRVARFFLVQTYQNVKIYQMTTNNTEKAINYTKWI
jgi:hypothetical protein